LPLALTGAWMLVELWGELTFGGVDNDLFGDLAFAGFLATFLGALLLFAARAARSAEGRDVQRYALLSAALLMYPAVFIGMSSVPTPEGIAAGLAALRTSFGLSGLAAGVALWSLFLVGNGLLILGVLAVLWLRIARAGGGAPARSARDVAWLALGLPLLGAILEVWLEGVVGPWPAPLNAGPLGLSRTIAVLILAYAMLRHQLLDIDVKVRWTIQQSTIAAAFIGVFFVVSESAQTLLAGSVGPYLGIAAAGLLLFAMAPLQRAAERVAGAAVPHARRQLPPEERAALYRDTARMAWADGRLTPDERRLLDGLRERLGLSADEASRLEREVLPGPTF
ncbi:MAG TPA: hypothetical protein VGR28_05380, partial [Candidatus Thermoplasmatota archaeon]|nr:hypothetical protein [Candidatus Thermoplasmatota archaeon]